MSDEKIAKKLLDGSSCGNCKYYDQPLLKCKILHPIKIKYPKDVEIFINGMLIFQGEYGNYSRAFVIGDEIHFKQTDLNFNNLDQITIYSRGMNESGEYDTEMLNVVHKYKSVPEEYICKDHTL